MLKRSKPLLLNVLLVFCLSAVGHSQGSQSSATTATTPASTLQTGITLVPVDVVVTDSAGHPVPGLGAADFRITENNTPQTTRSFEPVSAATAASAPKLPPLPPGVFTDYTPVSKGPLNVLLVDMLNTPLDAQIYLKEQLRDYIRKAPPNSRTAIFGLNSGLSMLQGFTANPATLRAAIDHRFTPGRSNILNDATGTRDGSENDSTGLGASSPLATSGGSAQEIASASALLQQFEAQTQAYQTQTRILDTINAFTALAHFLGGFPGRKNLVWFSGSFPINILGDPSINSPFQVAQNNAPAFHAMVDSMLQAQVAVYPVDARALETSSVFDAAHTGNGYVGLAVGNLNNDLSSFQSSRADEHATMESLAHSSGGKAYFNTNALSEAVASAISSGTNYYTLVYKPSDLHMDGSFRSIHVELTGTAATHGYTLNYRRGYYAQSNAADTASGKLSAAGASVDAKVAGAASAPFEATAMGHGAPEPSELLFKVRLRPASTETQGNVAPGNHVNAARAKGPFRTYSVDFAALASQLQLAPTAGGKHVGHVEFVVYVFDAEGNLLVTAGQPLDLDLNADQYATLLHEGLKLHMAVSAPVKGEFFFRTALHDLDSRKMGVVEVPGSAFEHLAPEPSVGTASGPAR